MSTSGAEPVDGSDGPLRARDTNDPFLLSSPGVKPCASMQNAPLGGLYAPGGHAPPVCAGAAAAAEPDPAGSGAASGLPLSTVTSFVRSGLLTAFMQASSLPSSMTRFTH